VEPLREARDFLQRAQLILGRLRQPPGRTDPVLLAELELQIHTNLLAARAIGRGLFDEDAVLPPAPVMEREIGLHLEVLSYVPANGRPHAARHRMAGLWNHVGLWLSAEGGARQQAAAALRLFAADRLKEICAGDVDYHAVIDRALLTRIAERAAPDASGSEDAARP
jgi:hypothetical protein